MADQTVQYEVSDISCVGCANALENALTQVEGVTETTVDVENKQVTVAYASGEISEEEIKRTIESAGYSVEG